MEIQGETEELSAQTESIEPAQVDNNPVPLWVISVAISLLLIFVLWGISQIFSSDTEEEKAVPKTSFQESEQRLKQSLADQVEEGGAEARKDHKENGENKENTELDNPLSTLSVNKDEEIKISSKQVYPEDKPALSLPTSIEHGKQKRKSTLNTVEIQLAELKDLLNNTIIGNTVRQESQDKEIKTLQAQVNAQKLKIEQLEHNIDVKKTKGHKTTAAKRVTKYRKPKKLPLSLVSIDLWGDKTYAIIRRNDMPIEHEVDVAMGETILGWRVTAIDRRKGRVVFTNKRGTHHELILK